MIGIQFKMGKSLKLDWPAQGLVLQQTAEHASRLLRRRIVQTSRDADGNALPRVQSRKYAYFLIHRSDPRLSAIGRSELEPWNMKGEKGAPQWLVNRHGYLRVKGKAAGHASKNGLLTGTMWRSLTATVKPGARTAPGGHVLRLYFAGSQVATGKGGKPVRFRNRDKARLLQYRDRATGTGYEPKGRMQFRLMAFNGDELQSVIRFYLSRLRIFGPGG